MNRRPAQVERVHITEAQMQYIVRKINERLDGECEDVDETQYGGWEVIGCGLDANVEFYATVYDDEWSNEPKFEISQVKLHTFDGGDPIPNDASEQRLKRYINDHLNDWSLLP